MTKGRPWPSQTACSLEFKPPLVRPIRRGTADGFEQAGCRAMGFEVGGVDHQPLRLRALARQLREDAIEHAQPAPPHEAVVDRLVRAVGRRRIPPTQTVPDYEDDSRDHLAVIHTGNPMRQRKIRLDPAHLRLRQPDQITHHDASKRR
jgi:hypothetical protein